MGEATSDDRFPLFSQLPTELRLEIWLLALRQEFEDRIIVSMYQERCWQHRDQREDDSFYRPFASYTAMEFDHRLQESILVHVPLFNTSHEARSATIKWAFGHGFQPQFEQHGHRLVRPMNPSHDVLHIPASAPLADLKHKVLHPDHLAEIVHWPAPAITRISTTAAAVQKAVTTLFWLRDVFRKVQIFYIIVGEAPEAGLGHRWELIPTSFPVFEWHHETQRFYCDNMYDGAEEFDFLLMDVSKAADMLGRLLARSVERKCEIRLARVIRC